MTGLTVIAPPVEYTVVTSPLSLLIDEVTVTELLLVAVVDCGNTVSLPDIMGARVLIAPVAFDVILPEVETVAGAVILLDSVEAVCLSCWRNIDGSLPLICVLPGLF